MEEPTFQAIPTLRILDYKKTVDFYVSFLGFQIDWEHRFADGAPIYMQVSRKGLILHLSENPRFNVGSTVFVRTKGVESFHKELAIRNQIFSCPPITIAPWKARIMEITDPSGNLLRFNEDVIA